MKIKYLIFVMFTSCFNAQKKPIIKNDEFKYDTSYNQNKTKYFVEKRNALNGERIASYTYSQNNVLLDGIEYHKWGWFSIKCTDSTKEINELFDPDTTIDLNETVLRREYTLNKMGDTICNESCYYTLYGLNQKYDSTKQIELQLHIPCSGFLLEDDVGFSAQLTITNKINIFRIYEFNTKSKHINLNIGELKKGKYKIYGFINVFHMINNTSISDMSRKMFLIEEINIY